MTGASPVRRLRTDEAEAYRALRLKALRQHPEAYSSAFEDEAHQPLEFFARRLPNTFGCFVDGALAGVAGLVVSPGAKLRHKGLVVGVYLDPAHRGQGLSRPLMESVIQEARNDGLHALLLVVTVGNEPAERLYRSLGFRQYGIEADAMRIGDARFDEALMKLDFS